MMCHRLHLPTSLLGLVCMLALLWSLASLRWALLATLCCLPWVFAFLLAYVAEPLDVVLLVELAPANPERSHARPHGTQSPNGVCDGRSPDARWL